MSMPGAIGDYDEVDALIQAVPNHVGGYPQNAAARDINAILDKVSGEYQGVTYSIENQKLVIRAANAAQAGEIQGFLDHQRKELFTVTSDEKVQKQLFSE